MKKLTRFGYLPLLAVLLIATGSSLAKAKDSRTVKLNYPVKVNGADVPAGVYKLAWGSEGSKVTIEKGKDVVGTLDGKWVDRDSKYRSDTVVYDTNPDGSRRMSEIRFAGSNKVLVIGEGSTAGGM